MSRRSKRDLESYLEAVKERYRFFPSLKKYLKRKRLNRWEKAAIARKEKLLRYTDHLIPVSKKQQKELKDILYQPETIIKSGKNKGKIVRHKAIPAVQLRNTGRDVRIHKIVGRNIFVQSNGRTWVYWRLPKTDPKTMKKYGEAAFTSPEAFDIEKVIELARQAFENPETKGVYLWADSGRVGDAQSSLRQFLQWITTDYSKYTNTDRWVNGIAILIADVGERISTAEWDSFGMLSEEAKEERRQRKQRSRNRR